MGEIGRLTNCTTGGAVCVDVQDDKIVRLTPLQFDDLDAKSWTIEARGMSEFLRSKAPRASQL